MNSPLGVFGYLDTQGALVCPSFTGEVWQRCQMTGKANVFPRESWGGIWGRALTTNQAMLRNSGLHVPAGHVDMERAIAVPIRFQNASIGLLMVANRAEDYTAADQESLEAIAAYRPHSTARCTGTSLSGNDRRRSQNWRPAKPSTACSSTQPGTLLVIDNRVSSCSAIRLWRDTGPLGYDLIGRSWASSR